MIWLPPCLKTKWELRCVRRFTIPTKRGLDIDKSLQSCRAPVVWHQRAYYHLFWELCALLFCGVWPKQDFNSAVLLLGIFLFVNRLLMEAGNATLLRTLAWPEMVKLMQPCAPDYRGELSWDICADQQQAERTAMPPHCESETASGLEWDLFVVVCSEKWTWEVQMSCTWLNLCSCCRATIVWFYTILASFNKYLHIF